MSKPTPVIQPPPPNVTVEDVLPPPILPSIRSTSPDGNYRLEVASMDNDNRGLRIVDSTTGEFEWVIDETFHPPGLTRGWSENSRFAAVETHTHYYADFIIIDTNDFSSVRLSIKDNFDLFSGYFPYEHTGYGSENYLIFDKWLDDSILQLSFETGTATGVSHGTFQYNAVNNRVSNFEYHEGRFTHQN